ncbi:MAG: NUDIX hydrolase [Moraxellaceae bacterium]|jgi:ADP-ribose pyrophosphatase YjhB (NUDIX family)
MKRFNVRVYGIHINNRNELLVADETYRERSFTKFPGGGLEWGEGTIACLKREFEEEFQLSIQVKDLLYTTDFFQVSTFQENDQVIAIYYLIAINLDDVESVIAQNKSEEKLRWIPINKLSTNDLTFPIDKHVVELLKKKTINFSN